MNKAAAHPQPERGTPCQARWTWALLVALSGSLVGCAWTHPSASQGKATTANRYHPARNDLALVAMSLLDTRYTSGGRGPATGFDCSGLVAHVYKEGAGLPVNGSAADLGRQSRPIAREQLQPGDLVVPPTRALVCAWTVWTTAITPNALRARSHCWTEPGASLGWLVWRFVCCRGCLVCWR